MSRKVWIRSTALLPEEGARKGSNADQISEEDLVGWVPALVLGEPDPENKLSVQLESWEAMNRKRPGNSGDDSDDSDSDFGEDSKKGVDEDAIVKVEPENIVERNNWEEPPADLVQLVHLHEPAILQALCERFWTSTIYTWCGPILLALNPFERLPLYSNSILESYQRASAESSIAEDEIGRQPHVYAVAADAYACLIDKSGREGGDQDQSILISGESGAGKTESTKIVMQYLATVARRPRADGQEAKEFLHVSEYLGDESNSPSAKAKGRTASIDAQTALADYSIEQQVLESNPILEAFGNARTIRNDNSSRFGKFIQIQFDADGFIVGASIATYLLEKVRITQQGEGERGYHVFYQMLYGGSNEEKESWRLDPNDEPEAFEFLNGGACYDRRDGVSDADQFAVTKRSMAIMGLLDEERVDVFKVVAVVLHLGNITFADAKGGDQDLPGSTIDSEDAESKAALTALTDLLGLKEEAINKALCMRNVNAGGETFEVPLKPEDATDGRDALAKSLYSRTFNWLVARVNECIHHRSKVKRFIGVLDIFGFEIFKYNSFEQLCINYANERLQQQFNDFVFKHEQSIYAKEKINWSFIDFPSNASTVELIDGGIGGSSGTAGSKEEAKMGILAILDDECRLPKGNDQGFASKLYDSCGSRDRFEASKAQRVRGEFVVHHYAGAVTYNSANFCDKNRDALRQEVVDLMKESSFKFICDRFSASKDGGDSSSKKRGKGKASSSTTSSAQRRSALSLASVSAEFKRQLNSLIETIEQTAPHYIRCIKPNDVAKAKVIHRGRVVGQLRCGGVLEAVRVARAGFPIRMPHKTFVERYGRLAGPSAARLIFPNQVAFKETLRGRKILEEIPKVGTLERSAARQLASDVLSILRAHDASSGSQDNIEELTQIGKTKIFMRKQGHDILEKWWSRWQRRAVSLVVATLQARAGRQHYLKQRNAGLRIQSLIRGKLARQRAHKLRCQRASLRVQTWIRMLFYRTAFKQLRNCATVIQAAERGRRGRVEARSLRIERARLTLQSWARAIKILRQFRRQRASAVKIQCLIRARQARDAVRELRRGARDLGKVLQERDALRAELNELRRQIKSGELAPSTSPSLASSPPTSDNCDGDRNEASQIEVQALNNVEKPARLSTRSLAVLAAATVTARLWFYMKDVREIIQRKKETLRSTSIPDYEPMIGDSPSSYIPQISRDPTTSVEDKMPLLSPQDLPTSGTRPVASSMSSDTSKPITQVILATVGSYGASDKEWYAQTFGEELEHLDKNLNNEEPTPRISQEEAQLSSLPNPQVTEERNRIEEELRQKRLLIEEKRAKLSEIPEPTSVELDVQHAEMVRNEQQAVLEARIDEFEHKFAEMTQALETKQIEIDEVKNFLAQQTSLKNRAEIKQGELELALNAAKEGQKKLERELEEGRKKEEELSVRIADFERERQANHEMARSSAVIELETELRNAHQEADELRKARNESRHEVERLKKNDELKAAALDDFRESSNAKINLLEKQMLELNRAKAWSTSVLQARVLIDRRSRRTAQHVISVWSSGVREAKVLRERIAIARRLLERRRLQSAFNALAMHGTDSQSEDIVVDLALARREHRLLHRAFTAWVDETRRGTHADRVETILAVRDHRFLCLRVFKAWYLWAALRLEDEVQFKRLLEIFDANRLRRHFLAWHVAFVAERRLRKLESIHREHSQTRLMRAVFYAWSREAATRQAQKPTASVVEEQLTPRSNEGSPSPLRQGRGDVELVARLMSRLERFMQEKDEDRSRLTPGRYAGSKSDLRYLSESLLEEEGLANMMPRSPQIEQLPTDDEDDDGDGGDDDDDDSEDLANRHLRGDGRGQDGDFHDSFYSPSPSTSYRTRKALSDSKPKNAHDVFMTSHFMQDGHQSSNRGHDTVPVRPGRGASISTYSTGSAGSHGDSSENGVTPFKLSQDGTIVATHGSNQTPGRGNQGTSRTFNRGRGTSVDLFRPSSGAPKSNANGSAAGDSSFELTLKEVGARGLDGDGLLDFEKEPLVADMDTVLQTARTLNIPPLSLAAEHGILPVLEQLLKDGVDPNVEDNRTHRTALHAAIQAFQWSDDGSERMVELLLEHGASVYARNAHGNTPLMEAVLKGDDALGLTKTLIRHGAIRQGNANVSNNSEDPEGANKYGQTPLHAAVRIGAVNTMVELLNSGASITRGDEQGQTALHHAARTCNVTMIHNLLGWKSLSREKSSIVVANNGQAKTQQSPTESGKNLRDLTDNSGNTALHLVCAGPGNPEMSRAIYVLLENDFDPNLKNHAGSTPLSILCSNKSATKKALAKFKRPNVRFHEQDRLKNTALHLACQLNNREIACKLVQMGAPLYIWNDQRETPLDMKSVTQDFAVDLLQSVRKPPDETLAKQFHRDTKVCMLCRTQFGYFRDQHHCRHCARVCCSRCSQHKYPITKFQIQDSVTVCDQCWPVLTSRSPPPSTNQLMDADMQEVAT